MIISIPVVQWSQMLFGQLLQIVIAATGFAIVVQFHWLLFETFFENPPFTFFGHALYNSLSLYETILP